jgi:hypothetical protein
MAQWKTSKKYTKLRIGKEQSDTKDWKSSTTKEMNQLDTHTGSSYRHYFHSTITRTYSNLGDATSAFNRNLRPLRHEETPTVPRTASPQKDDQQPHHNHVRTQTHPQDVTTGPDDPTVVLDSGAMMTTIPTRLILGTQWERNIHPAPPGTALRYGNMEVEHIEQISTIGTYQAQLFPDRHSTALVSTHDIITRGHVITFTNHRCIIEDAAGQYALRLPRIPVSREWRAP